MTLDVPTLDRDLVLNSSWHQFWFFFPSTGIVTAHRVADHFPAPPGRTQNMFCHTPIDNENSELFHMQNRFRNGRR